MKPEFDVESLIALIDPLALALVWIGSIAVVGLQEGRAGLLQSFSAWQALVRSDPASDALSARQAFRRVESIVDTKGLQCIDRVEADNSFVAHAVAYLASEQDVGRFAAWAELNLGDRERRHNNIVRFWMAVADVSPAIGMVGTIFGLVRLFSDLDNAANMGSAMALALLTTLYGLLLSNVIAAPISYRFQRLSSEELKWQRVTTDKLIALALRNEKQACS